MVVGGGEQGRDLIDLSGISPCVIAASVCVCCLCTAEMKWASALIVINVEVLVIIAAKIQHARYS